LINPDIDFFLLGERFRSSKPFHHIVIDNLFQPEVAKNIADEFPAHDSNVWTALYNNPIEVKKTCNHWDKFPQSIYSALFYLCSQEFISKLSIVVGKEKIYADYGLNGGGMHSHTRGGKLNIHKDYSIHPKINYMRNYNIIVYMEPEWKPEWGGGIQLWDHDAETDQPKSVIAEVENRFNRAIIFDTTQNSWHGLPKEITCPPEQSRKSLACYYMSEIDEGTEERNRALFIPYEDQKNDPNIVKFCEDRSK
jgi:Rps23 Pro-64 3,4-dihydroxylase Tpa1-like proline 4-hydroxylase